MIKSMTGYGKGSCDLGEGSIQIEVKTVNNKYQDYIFKLPNKYNYLEATIKNLLKEKLKRGRIEFYLKEISDTSRASDVLVNIEAASKTKEALQNLINFTNIKDEIKLSHLLINNEILEYQLAEIDENLLEAAVVKATGEALQGCIEMRIQEGTELYNDLSSNLKKAEMLTNNLQPMVNKAKETYRKRLLDRVSEILVDINEYDIEKINSEIVLYAERTDINEEIVRLQSHFLQFNKSLLADEPVGRKLDILTQEMNREANTICSKILDKDMKNTAIEIKSLIDKMKEQVQNVE